MGEQGSLCLARRLEPLHLPLAPARGLVRVLRPVVQPLVLPVLNGRHDRALGCGIAAQIADGHHMARYHLASWPTAKLTVPLGFLNDATYGFNIRTVYVTHQAVAGNAFSDAINGVTLADGRSATEVIRPLGGYGTHFHWTLNA